MGTGETPEVRGYAPELSSDVQSHDETLQVLLLLVPLAAEFVFFLLIFFDRAFLFVQFSHEFVVVRVVRLNRFEILANPVLVLHDFVQLFELLRDRRLRDVDAVRDGRTRDELNPKTAELVKSHGWRSVPITQGVPVSLDFSWTSPVAVRELHLWFDTGFSRELVLSPADGPYNRQGGSRVLRGPQPETVKDYDLLINGDVAVHVTGNYQRKVVHRFDRTVDVRSLQLRVHTTNGLPEARIFEVRAF